MQSSDITSEPSVPADNNGAETDSSNQRTQHAAQLSVSGTEETQQDEGGEANSPDTIDSESSPVTGGDDEQETDLAQNEDDEEDDNLGETFEIGDAEALYVLAERVNAGDGMENVIVILTADIILDSQTP